MQAYKGVGTAITVAISLYVLQIIMAYLAYRVQVDLIHGDGILQWVANIIPMRRLEDDKFIHWFVYIFPMSRLEDFIIGCNLGYIFKKTNDSIKKNISSACFSFMEVGIVMIILAQLVMYVFLISISANSAIFSENWWGLTVYWTITSCALVYLFAINQGQLSKALTNKPLLFIGNMSANAFLIHQMVYRYLSTLERKIWGEPNNYINILLCFILTMVSSYIWERINDHFRGAKLKNRLEL